MEVTDLVTFWYRNHEGKVAVRRVRPIRVFFGSTAWHPEPGRLLEAFDLDKQETLDFAVSGMLGPWVPLGEELPTPVTR